MCSRTAIARRVCSPRRRGCPTTGSPNTGDVSILLVDQGIEHLVGASFAPNPPMFIPEDIVRLPIESGSSAVALPYGLLGVVARKIPFIVKISHNELMSHPNTYNQTLFGDGRGPDIDAQASVPPGTGTLRSRTAGSRASTRSTRRSNPS